MISAYRCAILPPTLARPSDNLALKYRSGKSQHGTTNNRPIHSREAGGPEPRSLTKHEFPRP